MGVGGEGKDREEGIKEKVGKEESISMKVTYDKYQEVPHPVVSIINLSYLERDSLGAEFTEKSSGT